MKHISYTDEKRRGTPVSTADAVAAMISLKNLSIPAALRELGKGEMPRSFYEAVRRKRASGSDFNASDIRVEEVRAPKGPSAPKRRERKHEDDTPPQYAHHDQKNWSGRSIAVKFEEIRQFLASGSRFSCTYSINHGQPKSVSGKVELRNVAGDVWDLYVNNQAAAAFEALTDLNLTRLE